MHDSQRRDQFQLSACDLSCVSCRTQRLALSRTRTRLRCLLPIPLPLLMLCALPLPLSTAMAGLPVPVPAFHRRGLDRDFRCLRGNFRNSNPPPRKSSLRVNMATAGLRWSGRERIQRSSRVVRRQPASRETGRKPELSRLKISITVTVTQ